eukprot:jgi/Mesen1/4089/ME000214S03272
MCKSIVARVRGNIPMMATSFGSQRGFQLLSRLWNSAVSPGAKSCGAHKVVADFPRLHQLIHLPPISSQRLATPVGLERLSERLSLNVPAWMTSNRHLFTQSTKCGSPAWKWQTAGNIPKPAHSLYTSAVQATVFSGSRQKLLPHLWTLTRANKQVGGSHWMAGQGTRFYEAPSWSDRIRFKTRQLLQGTKAAAKSSPASAAVYQQATKVAKGPMKQISRVTSQYRAAAGLQLEAFWKQNYLWVVGAAGVVLIMLLWRLMFGIASKFIGFSEGMAKYGFLALSAAIVAFAGLYARARYVVNPDAVYRHAMRALNANAGVLEVLGAPLSGSDIRAYVMSGGGLRMKNFKPRLSNKRCFLLFPVRGSERKGLVSAEVKKKQGKYDFKLLAVDVPTAGMVEEQRVYVRGSQEVYDSAGGVISELRDPLVRAMAKQHDFEVEDEREAEEDKQQKLKEEEEALAALEEAAEKTASEQRENARAEDGKTKVTAQ